MSLFNKKLKNRYAEGYALITIRNLLFFRKIKSYNQRNIYFTKRIKTITLNSIN